MNISSTLNMSFNQVLEKNIRHYFADIAAEFLELVNKPVRSLNLKDRHDLRVLSRRQQSILRLIKDIIPKREWNTAMKGLKKLGSGLGKLREIDVATEDATKYGMNSKMLKKLRTKAEIKMHSSFSWKERRKLKKNLKLIQIRMQEFTEIPFHSRVEKLKFQFSNWIGLENLSKDEIHSFRILTKKVRYTIEAFGLPYEKIKKLQDDLGKLHDIEMLQKLLTTNEKIQTDENKIKTKILKEKDAQIKRSLVLLRKI